MNITKDSLLPYMIYDSSVQYTDKISINPIKMENILLFQVLQQSITLRKDSTFRDKQIIKMNYLDFLLFAAIHPELENEYKIEHLSDYYRYAIQLIQMSLPKNSNLSLSDNGNIYINDELITPSMFDDLRRIIIILNGIDFDIDEFLNYDTEQRLLKAQKDQNRIENITDVANIEDYIDSLVILMNTSVENIKDMSIRKFWRYIKRYSAYDEYKILKSAEYSGMVTLKEPIKFWMNSIGEEDKYSKLKTDKEILFNKIDGANA